MADALLLKFFSRESRNCDASSHWPAIDAIDAHLQKILAPYQGSRVNYASIGKKLGFSRSTAQRQIRRLAEMGLVLTARGCPCYA